MQTIFSRSYLNYTKKSNYANPLLKNATFEPLKNAFTLVPYVHSHKSYIDLQGKKNTLSKFGQAFKALLYWGKHKHLLKVLAIVALILPSKSLTNNSELNSLEKVTITKTLKVATTDQHLFSNDTHRHGFGYDIANRYAHHLGAKLDIVSFNNETEALNALKAGNVDALISDELYQQNDVLSMTVGCGLDLGNHGLESTTLSVNHNSAILLDNAKSYLCSDNAKADTKAMAKFYKKQVLDTYSINHFNTVIDKVLPKYTSTFKKVAKQYNHDWEVLAVISYQESHLNPSAVSRTGVQGLMMLTQDTAKAMGVADRTNASQSIYGGAKYLDKLNAQFMDIPEADRLWFVLSAYNMGPNAVKSIQNEIAKQGGNPKLWSDFYGYLSDNAHKNGRFVQCMHYVTNIRTYLETLKA